MQLALATVRQNPFKGFPGVCGGKPGARRVSAVIDASPLNTRNDERRARRLQTGASVIEHFFLLVWQRRPNVLARLPPPPRVTHKCVHAALYRFFAQDGVGGDRHGHEEFGVLLRVPLWLPQRRARPQLRQVRRTPNKRGKLRAASRCEQHPRAAHMYIVWRWRRYRDARRKNDEHFARGSKCTGR